jgi:hypothetical protein
LREVLKLNKFVFVVLFSLSLFAIKAQAYQVFNQNPFFTADANGYNIGEQGINSTGIYSCMNYTYWPSGQLLFITTTGACSGTIDRQTLGIAVRNDDNPLIYGRFLDIDIFNNTYITLPARKEGIVAWKVMTFQTNGTEFNGASYILVEDSNGTQLNRTYLLAGNTWDNRTIIIPPASYDRQIRIYMYIFFGPDPMDGYINSNPISIYLKQIEFYTLDKTEARDVASIFYNRTAEAENYCGSGFRDFATYSPLPGGFCTWSGYYYYNYTGFYLGRDINDQYCGIFAFNGLMVARRLDLAASGLDDLCVYNVGWPQYSGWMLFRAHDPFYFWSFLVGGPLGGVASSSFIATSVQLQSMVATTFITQQYSYLCIYGSGGPFNCGPRYGPHSEDYGNSVYYLPSGTLDYNGIPVNHVNLAFLATANCTNPPNDYCNFYSPYYFTLVNTTPYSTYGSPAGTKWAYDSSAYFPFFTSVFSVENAGWNCNPDTDYEYFVYLNGTQSNFGYCGACGCGLYRCNPAVAHWVCAVNNTQAWYYDSQCNFQKAVACNFGCSGGGCIGQPFCNVSSSCAPTMCQNSTLYSNPYCTVDGLCSYNTQSLCQYGCSSIFNNCNPKPASVVVCAIVMPFMGFSDCASAEFMIALIASLIVSTLITVVVSYKGGFGGGGIVFGISFIAMVILFAMTNPPWINPIAVILLVILAGILVAWQLGKIVSG